MTDADKTLIAALLDRSGSMQSIADDMRGGFDAYIAGEAGHSGTTATISGSVCIGTNSSGVGAQATDDNQIVTFFRIHQPI